MSRGQRTIRATSSTTSQLALGDALAIATMKYKKFGKLDFKKLHPSGSLGAQLKTVEDIMITGNKIPFVSENLKTSKALKVLSEKKLGILVVRDKKNKTKGIVTDGQIRRVSQKDANFQNLLVKEIMTKKPIFIDSNVLAAKALALMNNKKITSLLVCNKKKPYLTTFVNRSLGLVATVVQEIKNMKSGEGNKYCTCNYEQCGTHKNDVV